MILWLQGVIDGTLYFCSFFLSHINLYDYASHIEGVGTIAKFIKAFSCYDQTVAAKESKMNLNFQELGYNCSYHCKNMFDET